MAGGPAGDDENEVSEEPLAKIFGGTGFQPVQALTTAWGLKKPGILQEGLMSPEIISRNLKCPIIHTQKRGMS